MGREWGDGRPEKAGAVNISMGLEMWEHKLATGEAGKARTAMKC